MKLTLLFTTLFVFSVLSMQAQVGVGTTNPQQELHVAGENSTIRVDGLSAVNNANNLGAANGLYNILVNQNGDLAVGNQSGTVLSENGNTSNIIATLNDSSLNTESVHNSGAFTLTQRALVLITYSVTMDFRNFNNTANIDDGRAKIAHTFFYLGDGTIPDTSAAHGMTSNVYSNSSCDTATGHVYNTHTSTLFLEPGTYSVHLNGSVFGGGLTSAAAFSVIFGEEYVIEVNAIYL